jgi:hypothetical protein
MARMKNLPRGTSDEVREKFLLSYHAVTDNLAKMVTIGTDVAPNRPPTVAQLPGPDNPAA